LYDELGNLSSIASDYKREIDQLSRLTDSCTTTPSLSRPNEFQKSVQEQQLQEILIILEQNEDIMEELIQDDESGKIINYLRNKYGHHGSKFNDSNQSLIRPNTADVSSCLMRIRKLSIEELETNELLTKLRNALEIEKRQLLQKIQSIQELLENCISKETKVKNLLDNGVPTFASLQTFITKVKQMIDQKDTERQCTPAILKADSCYGVSMDEIPNVSDLVSESPIPRAFKGLLEKEGISEMDPNSFSCEPDILSNETSNRNRISSTSWLQDEEITFLETLLNESHSDFPTSPHTPLSGQESNINNAKKTCGKVQSLDRTSSTTLNEHNTKTRKLPSLKNKDETAIAKPSASKRETGILSSKFSSNSSKAGSPNVVPSLSRNTNAKKTKNPTTDKVPQPLEQPSPRRNVVPLSKNSLSKNAPASKKIPVSPTSGNTHAVAEISLSKKGSSFRLNRLVRPQVIRRVGVGLQESSISTYEKKNNNDNQKNSNNNHVHNAAVSLSKTTASTTLPVTS